MMKNLVLAAALLAPSLLASCAAPTDDGGDCSEGKCDDVPDSEVPDSPCDGTMVDESGANHKKVAGRLNDPIAKLAFNSGSTCPNTFQDIMAKLKETDKEGCPNDGDGIVTRLISETAQASGKATNYRAVTTRTCGGRGTEGIVFSLFGLRAGQTELPAGVEMIGFDDVAGVFNYYETDGNGKINFFGNSKDLVEHGTGEGQVRRCAGCHTGGGLIMKELDTPWMHWEGHENTPGAQELVTANKLLGRKNTGAEFEGVVKGGNTKWNKARIELFKSNPKAVENLLKPLFCSVEVNLDNGADFGSPVIGGPGGSQISSLPFDSLLDPNLKGFGSLPIQFTDYDAQIKANGQNVEGVTGAIDTFFDYVFIERSHADTNFIQQLKTAGILDDDLMKDVLMVDFTRPVFSSDRCALLSFVPDLEGADLTAQKIREGLINNLEAEAPTANSPGGVLLANLKATDDATAHNTKIDAFTNACKGLGSKQLVENALTITSLNRATARGLQVFEFAATMPGDDLNVNENARLSPKTCAVINQFEAP
jgi:hypothetical protein